MVRFTAGCLGGLLLVACATVGEQQPVRQYAAGSLRVAMTGISRAYQAALKGASAAAERYAQFILSDPAQGILAEHGFAAVR